MSVKEGLVVRKMFLPDRLKIEIQKLDDQKWSLHYTENIKDAPEEVIENTIKLSAIAGIPVKRRGKTLSYKMTGTQDQVFSAILVEALANTKVADITLREIIILATAGKIAAEMAQAQKAPKTLPYGGGILRGGQAQKATGSF